MSFEWRKDIKTQVLMSSLVFKCPPLRLFLTSVLTSVRPHGCRCVILCVNCSFGCSGTSTTATLRPAFERYGEVRRLFCPFFFFFFFFFGVPIEVDWDGSTINQPHRMEQSNSAPRWGWLLQDRCRIAVYPPRAAMDNWKAEGGNYFLPLRLQIAFHPSGCHLPNDQSICNVGRSYRWHSWNGQRYGSFRIIPE